MRPISLISLDFDGTIVNHETNGHPPVSPEFLDVLDRLKADGTRFLINTGRSLEHLAEGLEEFGLVVPPDFAVVNEREVYRHGGRSGGWLSLEEWNLDCARRHDQLHHECRDIFDTIHQHLTQATRAQTVVQESKMQGFIASTNDEMEEIVAFLDQLLVETPSIRYQRNAVYLRFCHADYHKGAALRAVADHLGATRESIFASGDNYNDLSMLDGRHAALVACPGNAVDAVKEAVRGAGGYVASGHCSSGVAEALEHFLARPGLRPGRL